MGNLQSNNPNSQPAPTGTNQEANTYEDEINLIDYLKVLWKYKSLILLGSVLPVFIVGIILFFSPRNYKVTYVYNVKKQSAYDFKGQAGYDVSNWNLNEKNYKVLLNRFFSAENIDKIISKLRASGLDGYAELISRARGGLKKLVDFEVLPPYINLSKAKITDPFELEQIRQLEAQLLNMTITGRPKNDISKIFLAIRDNFENVIPVYMVQNQLSAAIRGHRSRMANIEENRFNLELALKTNKAVLAKLKNIKPKTRETRESNIALQFDISGKTEYLPAEYQIQAIESKTVQLEEQIAANEETYNHYKDLLALSEKLFAEAKNKMSSDCTIQQFRLFLLESVKEVEKEELKDYLNSYTKRIENRIAVSTPVTENPSIYAVSKGTVKKSAIVFAISVMLSVFGAFLIEGLRKSQTQAS